MALSTVTLPTATCFTKQPVIVKIHTDLSLSTANLRIALNMHISAYGGNPSLDITISEPPDSSGNVEFDLSSILDELIDDLIDFPNLTSPAIEKCTGIMEFSLTMDEISGDPPTSSGSASVGDFRAFGGGLAFDKLAINFFGTYLPAKVPLIPFLTWKPDNAKTGPTDTEYLYYYVHDFGITSLTLMIQLFNFSNASLHAAYNVHTKTGVAQGDIYLVPVSYIFATIDSVMTSSSINPDNLAYYRIWLKSQTGDQVSETRTYFVDRKYYPNKKTFFFANSLFAGDFFISTGESEPKGDYSFQTASIILPPAATLPKGMQRSFNTQERLGVKQTSGYKTKGEIDWFRIFFLAEKKFEVINNKYFPIEIKPGTIEFPKPNDPLPAIKFEYSHQVQNKVYTPNRFTGT